MSEIKLCPKCGSKNTVANNFCEHCGAKLLPPSQEKGGKNPVPVKVTKSSTNEIETKEGINTTSPLEIKPTASFSFFWIQIAYAVLLLITVFTRFHHLGDKPHHHDESMHSYYSYLLFSEGNYKYDPMMHGPFQFHGNAFMYYLFGVSNATSRYLAAFFGILTVVLAMFLGPFFGRIGTLLATTLIVFSPSFMYFDRFTREDAYIAGATFLMVVFLFRYVRNRQPMDLWLSSLGFIIAFATKESMFITIAVIGTYIFIRLLPWFDVLIAAGLTAVGVLSQVLISNIAPNYPNRIVFLGIFAGFAFLYTVFQLYVQWRLSLKQNSKSNKGWEIINQLRIDKVQWDLLAFAGWWLLTLIVYNPKIISDPPHFLSLLFLLAYLGFLSRFCWLWLNNTAPALTGSISIIGMVFTLLFTTFFTVGHEQQDFLSRINSLVNALWNGAFGGLQYWWEQHDVRRGGQPWYYYLLELPANEMVSFFFSAVAMVYYGLFNRKNLPLFLSYWYLGSFALFSWAGEKMPWLILHPLLPSLLLTAYFVGQIIDSKPVKEAVRFARISALFLFGLFLTYSLHSAVLLTFYHEADPVEPLVYTQSGPDVLEVERIIRKISYGETGGPNPNAPVGPTATEAENRMHDGLSLTIQDYCSWPFSWYLRDFPKRNHPRPIPDPPDNPIVMTGFESDSDNLSYPILSKAGYVNRKYKLRVWWAPSWFKKGFPGSEMNSTLFFNWFFSNFIPLNPRPDMVDWNDLKKWILYRQVWSDLGSYNMRLWVRGDLAQKYDFTPQNRTDIPDDFSQAQAMPVTIVAPPGNKKKRAR